MSSQFVDAILIVAIAAVLLVPIACRVRRGQFDPFEPIALFAAAYGVMFVVRPAAMLAKDSVSYMGLRATLDVSATFTEMLAIALLGAVSFVVAYEVVLRRARPRTANVASPDLDYGRATRLAIGLAAVGIASFAAFLASTDGIATLEAIFSSGREAGLEPAIEDNRYLWQAFFVLVPAAAILLAVGWTERRPAVVAIALVLIAVFLLRDVPLGARISLLPLIGGIFVLYYLRRSSRPSLRTLIVLVLVAVWASAFLSDLRGRTTRGETGSRPSRGPPHRHASPTPFFSARIPRWRPPLPPPSQSYPSPSGTRTGRPSSAISSSDRFRGPCGKGSRRFRENDSSRRCGPRSTRQERSTRSSRCFSTFTGTSD